MIKLLLDISWLGGLAEVFDFLSDGFTSVANYIASFPLLLVAFGVFVAGGVIGLAVRLIKG